MQRPDGTTATAIISEAQARASWTGSSDFKTVVEFLLERGLVRRDRLRIRDAFEPLMREYEIGLSIGLVDSNFRGLEEVTLDTLVREADVCLYRSKKSGRNKTVVAV